MLRHARNVLVCLLGLAACTALGRVAVSESSSAVIPGRTVLETLIGDIGFDGFGSMQITSNQELQNQGVTRDQITTVAVTELSLSIVSPQGEDFTFLEELQFFVEAPGEEKVRIARGGPFPAGESMVLLDVDSSVDLAPYAAAERMTITTEATGQRPENATEVEATITLDVGIDVEGVVCGGGS